MKRSEAIGILNETQVVYFAPNGKKKVQEALDMAIEALDNSKVSAEKIQTDNADNPKCDLISRADAVKAVIRMCAPICDNTDSVVAEINALPSADRPQIKQTDTLIIADALRYLADDEERHEKDRAKARELREQILNYGASMCRPHGEWTNEKGEPVKDNFCVYCSNCKEWSEYRTDFCPNCGAIMESK